MGDNGDNEKSSLILIHNTTNHSVLISFHDRGSYIINNMPFITRQKAIRNSVT